MQRAMLQKWKQTGKYIAGNMIVLEKPGAIATVKNRVHHNVVGSAVEEEHREYKFKPGATLKAAVNGGKK